jgi:DNA-binding transcriptional ArsR family regulator
MHLVPEERAHRRTIDEHTVCDAIEGIGDAARIAEWASRFALLGEPGRLTLLLAVHHGGPIAVTDLAIATGISDTAVSQMLRLLRASGTVTPDKDGRVVRYRLTDARTAALLDSLRSPAADAAAVGAGVEAGKAHG